MRAQKLWLRGSRALQSLTPSSSAFKAIVAPAPPTPQCSQLPAGLGPSHLHAKLVLLKHTAEQVSFPEQRPPWSRPAHSPWT